MGGKLEIRLVAEGGPMRSHTAHSPQNLPCVFKHASTRGPVSTLAGYMPNADGRNGEYPCETAS